MRCLNCQRPDVHFPRFHVDLRRVVKTTSGPLHSRDAFRKRGVVRAQSRQELVDGHVPQLLRHERFDGQAPQFDPPHAGHARQNHRLPRHVHAVEVVARIGLGVSQLLRLPHRLRERRLPARHGAQHERERTAEDALHGHDRMGRRLQIPEGSQHGETRADRRFVEQTCDRRRRRGRQQVPVRRFGSGEDALVGRHDRDTPREPFFVLGLYRGTGGDVGDDGDAAARF
mmetsp:Transcript_31298/g.62023  ORF Transcript_31298/g.62023 Transcript_31298/m.62023 type:complete len:228 (-) Transcript_31298:304-987(-)